VAPTAAEDFIARHAVAIEHVTGKSPAWCVRSRASVHTVHAAFNYAEAQPCPAVPCPALQYPAVPCSTPTEPPAPHCTYSTLTPACRALAARAHSRRIAAFCSLTADHTSRRIAAAAGMDLTPSTAGAAEGGQVRGGQSGAPVLIHVAQAARAAARPPGHRRQDRALVYNDEPSAIVCSCVSVAWLSASRARQRS
jgi:hypothetical protein